ncbi:MULTISPECIES: hypothetical protein [Streptomyces]|uniref:hypothetical protein n=1 Tax=Streptomyces TaxID=1883 RepID=UPI00101E736B|nr:MULTISPECIES: hypothetical protein [Streptomyces]MBV7252568.1 hypothetical protein [Streptomyces sp. S-2]RZE69917.1 hypothetical protein C0R00_00620 [Streptomyces albidoflavus]RZE84308.1 hypothetical protein C0Q99_00550 [Streptomyces albidoflavus]RZE85968.1 hypothetical protein C0R01_00260 [Streptomyces albidoflavus]WTC33937.1 hypothetical protein OH723_00645 [Streptomyces albidoflavus]
MVVLALLAGAGWLAKPLWQPWWYAATLCGGSLSGGELAGLLPAEQLRASEDTFGSGRTRLTCGVDESDGRHFVLDVEAEIDTGAPLGPLGMEFTVPRDVQDVYPASVPGFYGKFGPVIVQECPELGRDSEGRKQRLVTKVYTHGVESDASPESLRTAVRIANTADAETGCGAGPLPLPERVEPPRELSPGRAKGTMCGWLAGRNLPRSPSGKAWKVLAPTAPDASITRCALVDSGTGETALHLSGWYGDWAEKPFERLLSANVEIPEDLSPHDALLGPDFGRARARCAGEPASFLATSYTRNNDGPALPMSQVRHLLGAFTADQAERRDCTGVELPGPKVHPDGD